MTDCDDPPEEAEDGAVGYRRPPKTTRFTKGQSGNPAGRPRGRHSEAPYEGILGRMVTIREGETERRVTAAEAFLLKFTKFGLEGDSAAARASLDFIEKIRARQSAARSNVRSIVREMVAPGSVTAALESLRMATKLDRYRETARMAIEPWLVEVALSRLPGPLSPAEQQIIMEVTRTPHKVRWPEWWSEYP